MSRLLKDDEVRDLIIDIFNHLNAELNYDLWFSDIENGLERLSYQYKGTDKFTVVEDGCSDEMGEAAYDVFLWEGIYYRVDYSYRSHYGSDYSYARVYEVTPKEKTITVYE